MTKARFRHRLYAYVVDFFFLIVVLLITSIFVPVSDRLVEYSASLTQLQELLVSGKIASMTYLKEYALIAQGIDQGMVLVSIANTIFIIGYFVILPYLFGGMTLGKKMMDIRVSVGKNKLKLWQLIVRSLFVHGLGYMVLSLLLLYLLPGTIYFVVVSILGFLQLILVFTSTFMVLYRKDNRGLQDVFSRSIVIKNK